MPNPTDNKRAEILEQLAKQHDQLLAELTELDQRIESTLQQARSSETPPD